ncbi:hypothetical protein H5410_013039 [Solanum commersonii]|uniref:Uncharacterized protein n=1 Tax=Solanum commersonii TaxID=4109 RepID=A0A9J6ATC5_SOLCO|nr:hypothetical protein H5410_013039 [Solanum commersonii]
MSPTEKRRSVEDSFIDLRLIAEGTAWIWIYTTTIEFFKFFMIHLRRVRIMHSYSVVFLYWFYVFS